MASEEQEYQDYLDYQAYKASGGGAPNVPQQPELSGIDLAVSRLSNPDNWRDLASSGLRGLGNLGDFAASAADWITPGQQDIPKPSGYLEQLAQAISGDPKAMRYGEGTGLGSVGEMIPGIATPASVESIPAALMAGSSAIGAGVGREVGGAPGEFIGSMAPTAVSLAAPMLAKALSGTADEFLKSAMNVQRSDAAKSAKFQALGSPDEAPLIPALKSAQEKGVFKGVGNDTKVYIQRNNEFINDLGDQANELLKAADSAQTDVKFPSFSKTKKFLKKNSVEENLANQWDRRRAWINDEWDGTISGLNEVKQKLYRKGYRNNTDSQGLDKAIAADIKDFIEKQADELLGKNVGKQIRDINAEQGKHLALRDLLKKNKLNEAKMGGLALAFRRLTVSPIGGAAASVPAAMMTGNPLYLLAGALGGAAATRTGQLGISAGSRAAGNAVSKLDNGAGIESIQALANALYGG